MSTPWMLLDVEGTTTPISFVYDCLFPYARAHLEGYLQAHRGELTDEVNALARSAREHGRSHAGDPLAAAIAEALALMDADSKATCLKSLQGKIWHDGYRSGALKGELFEDVAPAFRRWHQEGRKLAIYSSGSVQAQRLIFGHSTAGDLCPLIERYFDTEVGPKREARSYRNIAEQLQGGPEEILFATDVYQEAQAAREAGLQTVLMLRPGNRPLPVVSEESEPFPTAKDFSTI
jgi:enolase-phosphatase E1